VRRTSSPSASRHSDVFLNPYAAEAPSSAAPAANATALLVLDPAKPFESPVTPAPQLSASSNPIVAATESSTGSALLDVQEKKEDVRWLDGGPSTKAKEQPPNVAENRASASGPSGLRGANRSEVPEQQ
jgi:hypothetical protein